MRSINRLDDPAFERFRFDAAREYATPTRQIVTSGQTGDPDRDMAGQIGGALEATAAR